jgi:hypothetical protein
LRRTTDRSESTTVRAAATGEARVIGTPSS